MQATMTAVQSMFIKGAPEWYTTLRFIVVYTTIQSTRCAVGEGVVLWGTRDQSDVVAVIVEEPPPGATPALSGR